MATAVSNSISRFGWIVWDALAGFGRFTEFVFAVIAQLTAHPAKCLRPSLLVSQFYAVGVASIPVVAITGTFIGMILALEGYAQFAAIGQEQRMGGIINVSVTKQIGPVLAAVMVAGRVGGALAAELGSMAVTEQLDAMRAMDADPIRILVVPRVVACLVMTPMLTIYSDMLGAWGAWLVTCRIYGVSDADYWYFTGLFVHWWDPVSGLMKSAAFGVAIGLVACYKGFNSRAGAAGVGRAATSAFVAAFMAIIILNLVLAQFFNTVFRLFIAQPGSYLGG
jgi:phospholipid/cholesterol/gamma-HCH transport system permease protein